MDDHTALYSDCAVGTSGKPRRAFPTRPVKLCIRMIGCPPLSSRQACVGPWSCQIKYGLYPSTTRFHSSSGSGVVKSVTNGEKTRTNSVTSALSLQSTCPPPIQK